MSFHYKIPFISKFLLAYNNDISFSDTKMTTKTPKISFPTYAQMYPYSKDRPLVKQLREKLRYYAYTFLYKKQCNELIEFLNKKTLWQYLFTQDYYRFNPLLTTYCDKRFSGKERFTSITENLTLAEKNGEYLYVQTYLINKLFY